jgi:hypothetical protein
MRFGGFEHAAEDPGESWVAWLMARISLDEAKALMDQANDKCKMLNTNCSMPMTIAIAIEHCAMSIEHFVLFLANSGALRTQPNRSRPVLSGRELFPQILQSITYFSLPRPVDDHRQILH